VKRDTLAARDREVKVSPACLSTTDSRVSAVSVYRRKDAFYTQAKVAGYRSRAAFKLLQLAQRHRIFHRGDRVVDLGAWPGGWLQVAARQVGPAGKVVGVDVRPIDPLPQRNVTTLIGDVFDAGTLQQLADACPGGADVLLSDLAPQLSGVRVRDDARSLALARRVLEHGAKILKPGGALVVKLFSSEDLPEYLAQVRQLFDHVHTTRPAATRKGSAEIYAIAIGFRGWTLPS